MRIGTNETYCETGSGIGSIFSFVGPITGEVVGRIIGGDVGGLWLIGVTGVYGLGGGMFAGLT